MLKTQISCSMKRMIPFFVFAFALCSFWSCEKEVAPSPSTNYQQIDPVERYLNNVETSVLFASVKINHETAMLSGWLIDHRGTLRIIDSDKPISLQEEFVSEEVINELYRNSEIVRELDKEELVGFHQQTEDLSLNRDIETNQAENSTAAYVSYHLYSQEQNSDDCSSCNTGNTNSHKVTTFRQTLLMATGHINQASDLAQTINDYLLAFDQELGN